MGLEAYAQSQIYPGGVIAIAMPEEFVSHHYFAPTTPKLNGELRKVQPIERADTIFMGDSLWHPILAVTALTLVDEGVLRLDDPISRYLPEFILGADHEVAGRGDRALIQGYQPITIRDLLYDRSGLTWPGPDQLANSGPLSITSLRDYMPLIAAAPLRHAPGLQRNSGPSYEVLGAVLEAVTGASVAEVVHARIAGPLGLADTGWGIPKGHDGRLQVRFLRDCFGTASPILWSFEDAGALRLIDSALDQYASLSLLDDFYTTLNDYMLFCLVVARNGRCDDVAIVKSLDLLEELRPIWRSVSLPANKASPPVDPKGPTPTRDVAGFLSFVGSHRSAHSFVIDPVSEAAALVVWPSVDKPHLDLLIEVQERLQCILASRR